MPGLEFKVNDATKGLQGTAVVSPECFSVFDCHGGATDFSVSLTSLMSCLQIFGASALDSTMLTMSYHSDGKLGLMLEHRGVVTECELVTTVEEESGTPLDYFARFREETTVGKAIIVSSQLHESLTELDGLHGATQLTVAISDAAPFLRLSADGNLGCVEVACGRHTTFCLVCAMFVPSLS